MMNYAIFIYLLALTTLCSLAIDTFNPDTRYYNVASQQINLASPRRKHIGMYAAFRYRRSHWRSSNHTIDLWTCSALQLAQYFLYQDFRKVRKDL
jgi:hypothetical protein